MAKGRSARASRYPQPAAGGVCHAKRRHLTAPACPVGSVDYNCARIKRRSTGMESETGAKSFFQWSFSGIEKLAFSRTLWGFSKRFIDLTVTEVSEPKDHIILVWLQGTWQQWGHFFHLEASVLASLGFVSFLPTPSSSPALHCWSHWPFHPLTTILTSSKSLLLRACTIPTPSSSSSSSSSTHTHTHDGTTPTLFVTTCRFSLFV